VIKSGPQFPGTLKNLRSGYGCYGLNISTVGLVLPKKPQPPAFKKVSVLQINSAK